MQTHIGHTNHIASVPPANTKEDYNCVGSAASCVNTEKLAGGRLNIKTQQQAAWSLLRGGTVWEGVKLRNNQASWCVGEICVCGDGFPGRNKQGNFLTVEAGHRATKQMCVCMKEEGCVCRWLRMHAWN